MVLIDKAALLNKIATEVHYDSEHSLEMYAKMLSLINDAPDGVVRCKDCKFCDRGNCDFWDDGYGAIVSMADFCSQGERGEDGNNDRN